MHSPSFGFGSSNHATLWPLELITKADWFVDEVLVVGKFKNAAGVADAIT